MVNRLKIERDCEKFRKHMLGVLDYLEHLETKMASADQVSTTELLYMHFDQDANILRRVLDSEQHVEAFRRLYPGMEHMIDHGRTLCNALDELHEVRMAIVLPYADSTGKQLVRDAGDAPHMSQRDRAAIRGMTESQFLVYKEQVDGKGFLLMSEADKRRLLDAITSRMND